MGYGTRLLLCIFSPCILTFLSFSKYFCPCVWFYVKRLWSFLYCIAYCVGACVCCRYVDRTFPVGPKALGEQLYREFPNAEWRRIAQLIEGSLFSPAMLFCGRISPSDIHQGSLGNCWLMSALASLAELDGTIQKCFVTRDYSLRGKYVVKLYDRPNEKWVRVVVDDLIPCRPGTYVPICSQHTKNNAFWVMIMEKAFAKYCGSYSSLDGGNSIWALEAMTGDNVFKLIREPHNAWQWRRFELVHHPKSNDRRSIGLRSTEEVFDMEKLYNILWEYSEREACLSAASEPGRDTAEESQCGIVKGHAYSILKVKKSHGFKLVKLRNPWGSFEWQGDWSDKSPLWKQHPEVAQDLKFTAVDDGCFWMCMEDLIKFYHSIDVCDRSRGVDDLVLNLHEDQACGGARLGCVAGCCTFWCCCRGLGRLVCGHKSSGVTRKGKTCCCGACLCPSC